MKEIVIRILIVVLILIIALAADYYIATSDLPFWMKFALLK